MYHGSMSVSQKEGTKVERSGQNIYQRRRYLAKVGYCNLANKAYPPRLHASHGNSDFGPSTAPTPHFDVALVFFKVI